MVVSGRTDENNPVITATQSEERVQNNVGGQGRKQQGVKTINLRKLPVMRLAKEAQTILQAQMSMLEGQLQVLVGKAAEFELGFQREIKDL